MSRALLLLILLVQAGPSGASAPDSVGVRGTAEPLVAERGGWREAATAVMSPIRWTASALGWPAGRLARAYESSDLLRDTVLLLTHGVPVGPVRLEAFVNVESDESLAEVGLQARREDWLGEDGSAKLRAGWLDRERNVFELDLRTPPRRAELRVSALLDNEPKVDFFGLDARAPVRESHADQRRELVEVGASARPWPALRLGATAYARWIDLGEPEDEDEERVADLHPELYRRAEDSDYVGFELGLDLDSRDRAEYSRRGNLLRAVAGVDRARDGDDSDYEHYALEAQSFLDLFGGSRVLALRARAAMVRADDPDRLPYVELETAGGRLGPRGYERDRFRAARQLLLTAQYRYRTTQRVAALLFVDHLSLGARWSELRLDAVAPAWGLGLELGERRPITLLAGISPEGVHLSMGSENLFGSRSRRAW